MQLILGALESVWRSIAIWTPRVPEFGLALSLVMMSVLFTTTAIAATLETEVDRETVIDGEAVVLYISGEGLTSLPDTSKLLQQFRIVQSGVTSSNSILNGQRSRGFKVRLELQPKNIGPAQIPAFTVDGVSSTPIVIEVVPRGTVGVEPRDNVFVELSVDNDSPYVQEQVLLSLKIFDDGKLTSADPNLVGNSDVQIERLPLSGEEIVERNGERYRVNTFRYALFPQKSGDVTIDSVIIPASIRDKDYTGNLILRNTPTRRIELRTEPLKLQVKSRAAASTSGWWLPVKALELKHEWSEDINKAKLGEPFTLTIELAATGSSSTQLPEIPMPDVPGLKIYADTPQLASRPEQDNVVSVRREKWSVIPNKTGVLTLPEIVIKWWDTENDVEQQVVLPAQALRIDGAVEGEGLTTSTGGAIAADIAVSDETDSSAGATASGDGIPDLEKLQVEGVTSTNPSLVNPVSRLWQWIALGAMALWAITLFSWWWSSRKKRPERSDGHVGVSSESSDWKRLKSLSRGQDVPAYSAAVIQWAQSRWSKSPVHNLPEVGVRLGSRELTATMRHLDQQRYSGHQKTGSLSLTEIQLQLESAVKNEQHPQPVVHAHALPKL